MQRIIRKLKRLERYQGWRLFIEDWELFVISGKGRYLPILLIFWWGDVLQGWVRFSFRDKHWDKEYREQYVRRFQVGTRQLPIDVDASFFIWVGIFVHRFGRFVVVRIWFYQAAALVFFIFYRWSSWLRFLIFSFFIFLIFLINIYKQQKRYWYFDTYQIYKDHFRFLGDIWTRTIRGGWRWKRCKDLIKYEDLNMDICVLNDRGLFCLTVELTNMTCWKISEISFTGLGVTTHYGFLDFGSSEI